MYVRPNWRPTINDALPYSVRAIQSAYRCIPGAREFYVEVPLEPPSTNHIYRRWHSKKTNKTGFALDDAVASYREMVRAACWGKTWPMRKVGAIVIGIESQRWITKEHKVGKKDADNPIKAVLDGLKHALGFEDELFWQITSFKMVSQRSATHIWLYELTDVVDAVGGMRA